MNCTILVFQEDKTVEKRICRFLEENGYNTTGLRHVKEMYNVSLHT